MPDHFVEIVFAVLAVIYLALYARDYTRRKAEPRPARKAWLRVGLIFGAISMFLFYTNA